MTPEGEMTPETLRALTMRGAYPDAILEFDAHADAWEATEKLLVKVEAAYVAVCADYAASEQARQRAEKAVAEAKGLLGSAREGSRVWEHRRYDWFAALAGEEK